MSGLPWARLDSNIATDAKVAALLHGLMGHKAFTLYICSLAWSVGHGTDGRIPKHMLAANYGTPQLAKILVDRRLWEYDPAGGGDYLIHNFALRQQASSTTETIQNSKREGALKGNCIRWHGLDCGCWKLA